MITNSSPSMPWFAPVDLASVNAQASLLRRKDRKYVVDPDTLEGLLQALDGGIEALEIKGIRNFSYESIYFDTPELDLYLAAAHGRPKRYKVRTRAYLDSGLCTLEVKSRSQTGLTVKHRRDHPMDERGFLTEDAIGYVDQVVPVRQLGRPLEPALTVRYNRTTLLDSASSSRLTIDTGLRAITPSGREVVADSFAIVETKSQGKPTPMDRLLWSNHHRPLRFSKYCTLLAAATPGLPANRWNRTLRHVLDWSPQS